MAQADSTHFQFSTPAMEVERAVSEFRFGRPIVVLDRAGPLAAIALDCVAPPVYAQFAAAVENGHSLFLPGPRAARLGVAAPDGIAVPLANSSLEEASRLSYQLGVEGPAKWHHADPLMAAAAEIARIGLLLPAIICAPIAGIENRFAACRQIERSVLGNLGEVRQSFDKVTSTTVPLKGIGDATFVVFRGGLAQRDQIAIVVGKPQKDRPVPVRIHSSCITGDLCGSLKCDCGDQLRNGLASLKRAGGGVLLYLDQEGRGTGIGAKMRAYGYQHQGLDTIDADAELGFEADHRRYEAAVAMLRELEIDSVVLYTNNPTKIDALRVGGIRVTGRAPVIGEITAENVNYLRTKTLRADHMLDLDALVAAE